MVVVRRRSDGLYCKNNKNNYRSIKNEWTGDIGQCKPYRNEAGARKSLNFWVKYVECHCPRSNGRTPWRKNCRHEKARQIETKRRFDEAYEVVPVTIKEKP